MKAHNGERAGASAVPEATDDAQALGRLLARQIASERAEAAWWLIEPARRIVLLAHQNPDPDAFGSALGLAHALRPLGKECVVACPDPAPPLFLEFLPGLEQAVTELPDEQFDLVIAVDAGELSRYGALYERHRAFFDSATILNLDHHVTSQGCGQVNIIDVPSAAAAELITLFLLNRQVPIGREAAICLLAGIITDTRAFEFDATTERTLEAGAYLVSRGAVPADIIKPMYRMKPLAKARLWGLTLATLQSSAGGRLVWAEMRSAMLAAAGAHPDMDDGLPTYLIDIEGACMAALFREQDDGSTRVSLRTAGPYDAAQVARRFGGGGHKRAAGFTLSEDIETVKARVLPYLESLFAEA